MMLHGKKIDVVIKTLPVALLGLVLGACGEPTSTRLADSELVELDADAVLYDMENYLTTDGIRSGVIVSDTAYVYNDSSVIRLHGVDMTLYHDDGRQRAHITARDGRLDQRTEAMTARGDVVVRIADGGRIIESSELHYDPSDDRIWSDSASVYREGGRVTRGTCFRSDLEFRNVSICDIRGAADVSGPEGSDGGGGDGDGGGGA